MGKRLAFNSVLLGVSLLGSPVSAQNGDIRALKMAECASLFDTLTSVNSETFGTLAWIEYQTRWMSLAVEISESKTIEELEEYRLNHSNLIAFYVAKSAYDALSGHPAGNEIQAALEECSELSKQLKREQLFHE